MSGAFWGRLGIRITAQLLEPILCSEVEQEVQDRAPRAYRRAYPGACRRPGFQARRLLPGEGGCAKPAPPRSQRLLETSASSERPRSLRRRSSSVPSCFGVRVICSMGGLPRLKRAATASKRPPKPPKCSIGHGRRIILHDPSLSRQICSRSFPGSFRSAPGPENRSSPPSSKPASSRAEEDLRAPNSRCPCGAHPVRVLSQSFRENSHDLSISPPSN